jgi:hypothetical protein
MRSIGLKNLGRLMVNTSVLLFTLGDGERALPT